MRSSGVHKTFMSWYKSEKVSVRGGFGGTVLRQEAAAAMITGTLNTPGDGEGWAAPGALRRGPPLR